MCLLSAKIRFVTDDDTEAIFNIYAPYVTSSAVTLETGEPRIYDVKRRIVTISSATPFLVCEIDGKVVGFAYADCKKKLQAYAWNTYVYVYINNFYQRCNLASGLYLAVLSLLKAQGFRKAIALVTSSNHTSEAFHQAFGFVKVGTLENLGFKLGEWHSVSIFEKQLDDSNTPPEPTKSIAELDEAFCEKTFRQCEKIIKIR